MIARRVAGAFRYGAAAPALACTAAALIAFVWLVSVTATAIDSVLMALVLTTTLLLPLACTVTRLVRPGRR